MRLIDADALGDITITINGTVFVRYEDIVNEPTIEPKCADGCLYGFGSDECEGCLFTTVKSKRGRWIDGENMNGEKFLADIKYCSVCHKEAYWDSERGQQLFPCCPNCGARMEKE